MEEKENNVVIGKEEQKLFDALVPPEKPKTKKTSEATTEQSGERMTREEWRKQKFEKFKEYVQNETEQQRKDRLDAIEFAKGIKRPTKDFSYSFRSKDWVFAVAETSNIDEFKEAIEVLTKLATDAGCTLHIKRYK